MAYAIKELFLTLQGEGAQTGRAAVFCRFAGCNLWSGRAEDRTQAICQFCDTNFVGTDGSDGGRFSTAQELVASIEACWGDRGGIPLVVCTGGEPLLQLDKALVVALHEARFKVAIETNGTLPVIEGVDWVCVSPKAGTELRVQAGEELKLVYPQAGAPPENYEKLEFAHFFLQPMDGPDANANLLAATTYCMAHPQWRLSLQTHKLIGIR